MVGMTKMTWGISQNVTYEFLNLDTVSDLLYNECDEYETLDTPPEFIMHKLHIAGTDHILILPGGNYGILTPSRS